MPVRYDTLANRLRLHLMEDPRITSEAEANAELAMMSNVELVEVLSYVIGQMEAEEVDTRAAISLRSEYGQSAE